MPLWQIFMFIDGLNVNLFGMAQGYLAEKRRREAAEVGWSMMSEPKNTGRGTLGLMILVAVLFLTPACPDTGGQMVIGRIERVTLPDLGLKFEARIDTGTKWCSIHGTDAKAVKSGGVDYLEFTTIESGKKAEG